MKYRFFLLLCSLYSYLPSTCIAQTSPLYEFRAVWVATVENIDWPDKKGMSVEQQKAQFIHLLDMHQHNGMNAIVVQIRPAGDAFYPSQYEPWSEYLNGKQGLPPTPYYDPLAFMIEETHKRGMEFHAWLNPYRAVFNIHTSSISPSHITKIHPDWFLNYGNIKYFNPGLPQVREHVARVVKDLVTRYDIDAVHMDDYFYPYRIAGKEFPDEKTYRQYSRGLNKEDWRRSNCDSIIKLLFETIRNTNTRVKFGISPFGVWRNKDKDPMGSNTRAGQTNYDDLYADILLWLRKGWIDYVVPQLYWERGHKLCDYDILLDWWNAHTYGRQMYIGHAIERAGSNAAWRDKNELPNQIKRLRTYSGTQGSVYFNSRMFEKNPNGWSDSLRLNYYALPALLPPMKWIDSIPPLKPSFEKLTNNNYRVIYNGKEKIKSFAVFVLPAHIKEKLEYATLIEILVADKTASFDRNNSIASGDDRIFVAAVDLNNNLSTWIELK